MPLASSGPFSDGMWPRCRGELSHVPASEWQAKGHWGPGLIRRAVVDGDCEFK